MLVGRGRGFLSPTRDGVGSIGAAPFQHIGVFERTERLRTRNQASQSSGATELELERVRARWTQPQWHL